MKPPIDIGIIKAAGTGCYRSCDTVYDYIKPLVMHIVFTKYGKQLSDNELAINSVLSKILLKLDKFDINKGTFTSWASQITNNHCIDEIRSKRYKNDLVTDSFMLPDRDDDYYPLEVIDYVQPDDIMHQKEQQLFISYLLKQFSSEKHKKVIYYRYVDELSYDEIVEKTKIKLSTIKGILHKFRDKCTNVKQSLKEQYE